MGQEAGLGDMSGRYGERRVRLQADRAAPAPGEMLDPAGLPMEQVDDRGRSRQRRRATRAMPLGPTQKRQGGG